MSRLPRLLRTLHSSAAPLAAAPAASTSTPTPLPPVKFTPKGRPIHGRPARTTRVTLPSGYPEPASYPVTKEYVAEIDAVKTKPKAHPLWAFFHLPTGAEAKLKAGAGMPDNGSLQRLDDEVVDNASGRSWTAAELRHKSFEDLHTLWYILLRERNVLATQREERRRLGIAATYGGELLTKRAFRCRKSMSRIKYILNERRLGIIAAGAAQAGIHGVHVPTTVGGMNDPIAAVEALGGARAPDMAALLPPRMKKAVEEMYEEEVGEIEAPKEEAKAAEAEAEAKEVKKE